MKKIAGLLAAMCLMLAMHRATAQDLPCQLGMEPVSLTPGELFVLANIPEVKLPARYLGDNAPLLPVSIDNSTQPYFRPITWQSGYECGQSAGVAFNFTYEIDRLRGVAASQAANQYPTHFVWDFLNNANNYQGASFFDSWEIVRACGTMNVADYGGALNTGGYTRWISGYNVYYNGMSNRLNSVKAIRVDTPEGLLTLKYWLYEHLEGSPVGGVGNIYGQYFGTPSTTLPAGTPEAGKFVQTYWGGSPSHAWTICGYNDSIRYDFNGDGQYTNHLDINGDGTVDMHDWEIGGLKFANGYAGLPWSNSGFCYTMYKNLADNIGFGGIWNHTVYIIDVKSTCSPKLTMKVTLKHTSRNKLKVTAGVSTDVSATVPSYVQEFPIFNNQGGDLFMQGGTTEADKTIEFGLDLAPLVNQANVNLPAKFFLQVQETDPSSQATGEIVGWSLLDYTGTTPFILNYPGANIPIQNNTITRLSLTHTLTLVKPVITNANLPPAQLYQPYDVALSAGGGTPPYRWDAKLTYPESTLPATFPTVTAQPLTLTNNNTGYAVKTLDFSVPFYKGSVNKVYVYADGYILFDDQPFTYPYLIDKMLLFRQTRIIAPFMADLGIYPSQGQGIWYEGNGSYAIFRWKASLYGMQGSTNLNFAVKLFPNGTIEYYYGDMTYPIGTSWTGGLSSGDNKNFQFSAFHNGTATPNTLDKFLSCGFPPEMEITEDGHFQGMPEHSYQNLPIKFEVTDNNNLSSTKTLLFSSYGLLISQTVISGGDSLVEFGETATITIGLNNVGTQTLNQLLFTLTETDPWITLLDSTETVNTIAGGQVLSLANALSFKVSPNIPDNHAFTMMLHVQAQEQTFQRPLPLVAHAPVLRITSVQFDDGDNGRPEPGESAGLRVTYSNAGSVGASGIQVQLVSPDTNLVLNTATGSIPLLAADSSHILVFAAAAGSSAPLEHIYPLYSHVTANNDFAQNDTTYLFSGEIVEDFETGNLEKFPWYTAGTAPWLIESGVKFEGSFSARSGWIGDSQESQLLINVNVLAAGPVSFYKYVSCEHDPSGNLDYDYLLFKIDNFEMQRWDGVIPWSQESFWLTPGYHTLSWTFHKDYSTSTGWDGCLIDFIKFPLIANAVPLLSVTPPSLEMTLPIDDNATLPLTVTNAGGGILKFATLVFDTTANKKDGFGDNLTGSHMTCLATDFVPGETFQWQFRVMNLSPDNEYIRDIRLDFPPGVVIDTATAFTGGSLGDLALTTPGGNGVSLRWHGESTGGRGVIKPGDTAVAAVNGFVGEGFINDIFVIDQLLGDNMGGLPNTLTGSMKIANAGLPNGWLTVITGTGSLPAGQSTTVLANVSTTGLVPGDYRCSLVIRDPYNNHRIIPVILHVTFPVSVAEPGTVTTSRLLGSFPNPFTRETEIRYSLAQPGRVTLEVSDCRGILIRQWDIPSQHAGNHSLTWDGTDGNGHAIPAGIYICRMTAGKDHGQRKMIVIR